MLEEYKIVSLERLTPLALIFSKIPFATDQHRVLWASLIFLVVLIVHRHQSHPLSKIPSIHWSAPWSRCYILWQVYLDRRRWAHYAGHMKTPDRILPVVRVAPNEVSIMTIAGIDTVYKAGYDRSSHYLVFQNFGYGWY